jgi:putative ABC transport system permease protein
MNLAMRDLRHQLPRFVATGVGLGLLFAVVLAMGGIYRGLVEDATVLIDRMDADLWIVQRDTHGPFAERSTLPSVTETRARVVPGVAWARFFTTTTLQPVHHHRVLRMSLVGLAWPEDRGASLAIVSGRAITQAHRELLVDRTLGVGLDEMITLGDDSYRVVGITEGLVASGGDALAFATQADVARIQGFLVPEARRTQGVGAREQGISAVMVRVAPGVPVEEVRRRIEGWPDASVYTTGDQRSFLLEGVVDKARRQIGLFRALLAVVSTIVVTLVVFNMTVAKTHEIALLKLMGARLPLIVSMIVQQSVVLSLLAYGVALAVAQVAFPHFPRRVIVGPEELVGVFALAIAIALVASLAAVRRALRIPSTTILAG